MIWFESQNCIVMWSYFASKYLMRWDRVRKWDYVHARDRIKADVFETGMVTKMKVLDFLEIIVLKR